MPAKVSAAMSAESTAPGPKLTAPVLFSQSVLTALWWFILVYEVLAACVLACYTYLYYTANDRNSLFGFLKYEFLFSKAQRFLDAKSKSLALCLFCLASMFTYGAITMLIYSLARRRFCYGFGETSRQCTTWKTQRKCPHVLSVIMNAVGMFVEVITIWKSFGIRGQYFQAGNLIREVIETVVLTMSAYSSSSTISNVFINQGYGVLIAANCFVPTLLSHAFRGQNPTLERLVCVFADMILDLVWDTVFPLLMFLPYVRLYQISNTTAYVAPPNVEQEVERMLVLSTSSFIQTVFPFLSSLANLRAIKQILSETKSARAFVGSVRLSKFLSPTDTTLKDGDVVVSRRHRIFTWLHHWMHRLLFLYGVVVLVISICASSLVSRSYSSLYQCSHRVYPWLTLKEACAGRTISCTAAGLEGRAKEIASALSAFDEFTLSSLELSNCSQLEIPVTISQFGQLNTLVISNSNLNTWSMNASVTAANFHNIQTVMLHDVTLANEPVGFTRVQLPISLEWVSLSHIDVSTFIDEIGTNWAHLKYFYCDSCNLTRFPKIVRTMTGLLEFSAMNNAITLMDESQFAASVELNNIWLDGSPLSGLPDSLWAMSSNLWYFSFQQTLIASVPLWINDISNDNLQMYGYGAPVCANATESGRIARLSCAEIFN